MSDRLNDILNRIPGKPADPPAPPATVTPDPDPKPGEPLKEYFDHGGEFDEWSKKNKKG